MAILTYHHIGLCPEEQRDHPGLWVREEAFREQLRWLKEHGWKSVSLDQVRDALLDRAPLPRRWVVITFDDGWRDNYTRALPHLVEFGFSAHLFMITGRVREGGARGAWDEYLSADEIREMIAHGVSVGSHTHTHPRLAKLSAEQVRHELTASREALTRLTGEVPRWLCYPYGSFSPAVAEAAREAGYAGALSTIRDNRPRPDQLYWLPRVMVMGDTTPQRLRYMLSGFYHLLHAWKNRRRWSSIRK